MNIFNNKLREIENVLHHRIERPPSFREQYKQMLINDSKKRLKLIGEVLYQFPNIRNKDGYLTKDLLNKGIVPFVSKSEAAAETKEEKIPSYDEYKDIRNKLKTQNKLRDTLKSEVSAIKEALDKKIDEEKRKGYEESLRVSEAELSKATKESDRLEKELEEIISKAGKLTYDDYKNVKRDLESYNGEKNRLELDVSEIEKRLKDETMKKEDKASDTKKLKDLKAELSRTTEELDRLEKIAEKRDAAAAAAAAAAASTAEDDETEDDEAEDDEAEDDEAAAAAAKKAATDAAAKKAATDAAPTSTPTPTSTSTSTSTPTPVVIPSTTI